MASSPKRPPLLNIIRVAVFEYNRLEAGYKFPCLHCLVSKKSLEYLAFLLRENWDWGIKLLYILLIILSIS
jgi:hypothetical protein